jgi:hypothetical protein
MNSLEYWYYEWLLRRRVVTAAADGSTDAIKLI